MQIINIVPVGNICMEYTQPMHMYLTHLVEKYPMYIKVAQQAGGYKILDNSLIELGNAMTIERVLDAAEKIKAHEIILPDVFQDCDGTLRAIDAALTEIDWRYSGECPFNLMAVAQGKTWDEWDKCYEQLMADDRINVIGIPKVCAKMLPGGRPEVMRRSQCRLSDKKHHLLGLWYSASELYQYEHPELIRSCDTVLASFIAKHNLTAMSVRPDGFTVDLENDVINPQIIDAVARTMYHCEKGIRYGN